MTNESSTTSIEVLNKLADDRRKRIRAAVENVKAPDYLMMIAQSEISYVIDPAAFPYSQIDLDDYGARLHALYKLKPQHGSQTQPMPEDPIENMLQRSKANAGLLFVDGRFELSDRDFIEIKAVRLTSERIHLILKGPSSVADVIIADCIESLYACAGVNKKFEEVEKYVQLKEYGTATKVRLKAKLEGLISAQLHNFLDTECVGGRKFAQHTAPKSYLDSFELNDNLVANWAVNEISIKFNVFDPVSGDHNSTQLRFVVGSLTEYGTGVYTVVSELPYDLHIELMDMLIQTHADES